MKALGVELAELEDWSCCGSTPAHTVDHTLAAALAARNLRIAKDMKCGVGLCGRCNLGPQYVCVDGPVYTAAQLKKLPDEM